MVFQKSIITVNRYLAGEFAPNYSISKNIGVGIYYLYSYCLDEYAARNTNFISAQDKFFKYQDYKTVFY